MPGYVARRSEILRRFFILGHLEREGSKGIWLQLKRGSK
jgi:hypothetical protein